MNHLEFCPQIIFLPFFRHFSMSFGPFYFIAEYFALAFFHKIDFFFIICSPKIGVRCLTQVFLSFQTLYDYIVFPKLSDIVSDFERVEISDKCVAETIITEKEPVTFTYFLA